MPRLALCFCLSLTLCACNKAKEGGTQLAAKVNAGEITVHQINFALQNANITSADQGKEASVQVLNRLVDQELLVQQAREKKLDRDPAVMQAIEEARREVLARAYLARLPGASGKPGDEEVKRYYTQHPELFSDRRIYSMREVLIAKEPGVAEKVSAQLEKSKNLEDLVAWLKEMKIRHAANAAVKPAEQIPLESLARFYAMSDGEIKVLDTPQALAVVLRVATRSEPVDIARARPMIEQFLGNLLRTEAAEAELKRLKASAKIEYVGEFAKRMPTMAASAVGRRSAESGFAKGVKGLK
ncbi:EpsD family peptidyl-prolyl cis-trans isomerase [Niveibacterium terrae]|uniref:EpsD family peptidyl-prolyl cis-trans isomerase n=1 Tax=Niveibacterium terrae TaxID=3373598 RepID=UPI003A8F2035